MNTILSVCDSIAPSLSRDWLENFIEPIQHVDFSWTPENAHSYRRNEHPDIANDWPTFSRWTKWFLYHIKDDAPKYNQKQIFLLFNAFQIKYGVMPLRPSAWPVDAFSRTERYTTSFSNPVHHVYTNIFNTFCPRGRNFVNNRTVPGFIDNIKVSASMFDAFLHDLRVLPSSVHFSISGWVPCCLPTGNTIELPASLTSQYNISEMLHNDRSISQENRDNYRYNIATDPNKLKRFNDAVAKSHARNIELDKNYYGLSDAES